VEFAAVAQDALRRAAGDGITELRFAPDVGLADLRATVQPVALVCVARVLRDDPFLQFDYPADLCGTDDGRQICLWYRLWSSAHNRTAILDVVVPADDPSVPSLCEVWAGMDWYERECFDMLGVRFEGHPRSDDPAAMRILLPEDWVGHPFRKDYVPAFSGNPLHGPQETN
jgi:NADH:ubiquinone oxidoreductase subunit C